MWTVLVFLWGAAGTSVGTLWMSGDDLHMTPLLLLVLLLSLLTASAALVHGQLTQQAKQDELLDVIREIRDAFPTAEALVAKGILRGHEGGYALARREAEDAANLPRLSDRRR